MAYKVKTKGEKSMTKGCAHNLDERSFQNWKPSGKPKKDINLQSNLKK